MPSFIGPATERLLDLLGRHRLTATVFVVGADAEREDGAKAVAEIVAAGHEVANHSYEPNCEYVQEEPRVITFVTIKPVKPGDELTIDYGEEWWSTRNRKPD